MISSPESGGSWWNSNPFMFESESEKRKRKRSQPLSVLRGPLLSAAKMRSSLRIFFFLKKYHMHKEALLLKIGDNVNQIQIQTFSENHNLDPDSGFAKTDLIRIAVSGSRTRFLSPIF
jgi:hypothetical protein